MALVRGDRIGESQRLNACSIEAQEFYALFVSTVPDDYGRFRATPAHVAIRMYPRREPTTDVLSRVGRMLEELRNPKDSEPLWKSWEVDGVLFGELTGWRPTGNRYHRTPEPEWSKHVHAAPCLGTAIARAREWKQPDEAERLSNVLKEFRDRRRAEVLRKPGGVRAGRVRNRVSPSPPSPPSPLGKETPAPAAPASWSQAAVDIWLLRFPDAVKFQGELLGNLKPLVKLHGWKSLRGGGVGEDFRRYVLDRNVPDRMVSVAAFVKRYRASSNTPASQAKAEEAPIMPANPVAEQAWAKLLVQLEAKVDPHNFALWFRPTYGSQVQPDKLLIVVVPIEASRQTLQKSYGQLVSDIARAAGFAAVKFVVGRRPVGV